MKKPIYKNYVNEEKLVVNDYLSLEINNKSPREAIEVIKGIIDEYGDNGYFEDNIEFGGVLYCFQRQETDDEYKSRIAREKQQYKEQVDSYKEECKRVSYNKEVEQLKEKYGML